MAPREESAPSRRGRPRATATAGTAHDPREGIVAAASALFSSLGVDAVTMAQIAERAGLKQSSIYYWFKSKSEILAVILEQVNRIPLGIVERELAASGPAAVRLVRVVREDVLALCDFPFDINEVHRLAARSPDDFANYWDERQQLHTGLESLLTEGVASGELRTTDVTLAAWTLLATDEGSQNWYRSSAGGGYDADAVAAHVAEVAVRSLLADPATWPQVVGQV